MINLGSRNVPFDHDNEKYMCCCCSIHSKRGAYVIAFISAFFVFANFVLKAAGISDIGWNWELLFLFVDLVAVACLVGGLWTERAALLQPFVVLSIVTISFLILLTLFFASAVYDSHSYAGEYVEMQLGDRNQEAAELLSVQQRNVVPLLSGFVVVALSVATVVHIWFLIVVVQCAQYLRDMRPIKENFKNGYSAEALAGRSLFADQGNDNEVCTAANDERR